MKALALSFLAVLLFISISFSQDVVFQTQEDIDSWSGFSVNSILITGPEISSLENLSGLINVNNSITIENTDNLITLEGLNNISGDLESMIIQNNNQLIDASALQNLLPGNLIVSNNPQLQFLGDFQGDNSLDDVTITANPELNTESIGNGVSAAGNIVIQAEEFGGFQNAINAVSLDLDVASMDGFGNLNTVFGDIIVRNTINLPSLILAADIIFFEADPEDFNGLSNLSILDAIIFQSDHDYQTNFTGLNYPQILSIELYNNAHGISFIGLEDQGFLDAFTIDGINDPISLEGMEGFEAIDYLTITNSLGIVSLNGLSSSLSMVSLNVTNNPNLIQCCGLTNLTLFGSNVESNGSAQCNSFPNWSISCGTEIGCTSFNACNYNPNASTDDGSCFFVGGPCDDNNPNTENDLADFDCNCLGVPIVVMGCTYPQALNYNALANDDDGSCVFQECLNGDLDGNEFIDVNDLLELLLIFGQPSEN